MTVNRGIAALVVCTLFACCSNQVSGPDSGVDPTVALVISASAVSAPQQVTLSAAAADFATISKIEFFEGATKLSEASAAPYVHVLDITAANNGSHSYTAKATDTGARTGVSPPVTLAVSISGSGGGAGTGGGTGTGGGVGTGGGTGTGGGSSADTTPPVVSLSASLNTVTVGTTVTFTAIATDDVGVLKVELWDNLTKVAETPTRVNNAFTFTVPYTAADDGFHRYTARAFDAAINSAVSPVVVVSVAIVAPSGIKDIVGGAGFVALVKNDGHVYTAGFNQYGTTGGSQSTDFTLNLSITDVSSFASENFAYTALFTKASDGSVRCIGDGTFKQCGSGSTTGGSSPVTVLGLTGTTTQVAIGGSACARRSDGTLWCWSGYQGNPTTNDTATPLQVVEADGGAVTDCAKVFGCPSTMYFIRNDGSLWGWGQDNFGQVGDGISGVSRLTPVRIRYADATPILDAVELSCGSAHKVVLVADGGVFTFGSNYTNQLGIPGQPLTLQLVAAAPVTGLAGIVDVAAGYAHTVALDSSGSVYTWGSNVSGELGDGTFGTTTAAAVQVAGLPSNIVKVGAGNSVSYALSGDNKLYGWGAGSLGVTDAGVHVVHPVLITVP